MNLPWKLNMESLVRLFFVIFILCQVCPHFGKSIICYKCDVDEEACVNPFIGVRVKNRTNKDRCFKLEYFIRSTSFNRERQYFTVRDGCSSENECALIYNTSQKFKFFLSYSDCEGDRCNGNLPDCRANTIQLIAPLLLTWVTTWCIS